ncbi:unnamed protein product [Rhizophagus irregularis]|nr:unnamed protein product [Rhizophagus irregularis]
MSIENCIDESEFEGDIKVYMEGYFDEFLDKYNEYVLDIINITMTNEYTEFEEKKLEPNITTKPAKLEGETFKKIMTKILFEKAAAVVITSGPINKHEATRMKEQIIHKENDDMKDELTRCRKMIGEMEKFGSGCNSKRTNNIREV